MSCPLYRDKDIRYNKYCRLEFICDEIFLRFLLFFFANIQNRKNIIAKNFNGYIVIIVVINFRKKFRS